jgi:hypothetical protein
MNPLINAYNYKISQLQEQISYLLRENNNIIRLFEDTPPISLEKLDQLFPGWRTLNLDPDILRKYVTPGGGYTPAGRYLADLMDTLRLVQPGQIMDIMADAARLEKMIQQIYRYLHALSEEQILDILRKYGLEGMGNPEFFRNLNKLFNNKKLYEDFLQRIIKAVNPSWFGQIANAIRGRPGFASTRLLAIIAALVAAGVAIEIILQYLDSGAGQNEEWPDDLLGPEPENVDPFAPTATEDPSSVTPSFPSEIPSTTTNPGMTPPGQSRPELPY